ncbi:MAG: adenylate/guanylate cyclase domain-containing protein, partial [Leptospiraceae bacterium]|nr:adenylate/guanylate cyclase domain-containing protein [Leptospiraceae bacterium]
RKHFITLVFLSFLANAVVVVSISWLSKFFIRPEHIQYSEMMDNNPWSMFFSRIFPFLIVMPIIFNQIIPCLQNNIFEVIKKDISLQKRILQIPFRVSIFATAGWIIGTFSFSGIAIWGGYNFPQSFIINSTLFSWVLAALALVFMFYVLEFLNRSWILPKISSDFSVDALKGSFNLSLHMRFVLHLIATVGIPISILSRIIFFLDEKKTADFHYLGSQDLVLLIIAIVILGIIFTWMQSRFITFPVKEMQAATGSIQKGDFQARVQVTSGDEIGTLAVDINSMARGLQEREEMRETFGKIVDPSVRDYLLQSNHDLDGERKEISVLFCDLAGFTAFSEKHSAEQVVEFLNRYFTIAQNVVTLHKGVINKFIGDAFMAIFNAPLPLENHAEMAVQAALAFRKEFGGLLQADLQDIEKPDFRIGIHTGTVIAGRIGSSDRQEYTVIGDTVNVASRIEALGKKVKQNLLISEDTHRLLKLEYKVSKVGSVRLRGKTDSTGIYSL